MRDIIKVIIGAYVGFLLATHTNGLLITYTPDWFMPWLN